MFETPLGASLLPETNGQAALLLRHFRSRAGLTQEELADVSGISVRCIRDLERGKTRPRPSTLRKIADSLSLDEQEQREFFIKGMNHLPKLPVRLGEVNMPMNAEPAEISSLESRSFIGRKVELEAVSRAFQRGAAGDGNLIFLVGMPGVGKTALAVRWALENYERFPGGVYFFDSPTAWGPGPVEGERPLVLMLRALGIPVGGDEGCSAMLAAPREELRGRRTLVILDDVPSAAHVRSVLSGISSLTLLVTSRRRMDGLVATHGASQIVAPVLQDGEAAQLVAMMGLGEGHGDLAERISQGCAGHPLALRIASVASLQYPELFRRGDIGKIVMRDDVMGDEGYGLRSRFQHEYRKLPAEAAKLFRYLAANGGRPLTVDEASAGFGVSESEAAQNLSVLCSYNFVQRTGHGVYESHRIARAFAQTLVAT